MKVYEGDDELNLRNYISGEFIEPETGEWLENFSPATGKIIALVPKSGQNDINMAVESAIQALPSWSALTNVDRANWLDKIADKLETKYEEIAELESKDTGKPISLAREVDAYRSVKNFRFFANMIRNLNEESYEMEDATNRVIYKPVGVGALITPWNLPLYLLSWKVAPAIGMGNTVVCKPSEMTPLTADLLMKTIDEIGLPKGVVNLVHGDGMGAGSPLVSHENVSLVSFTGGTSTGSIVAKSAASSFKKLSLELGGKNASIIFDDCNLENTVKGVVRSGFLNQGQVCLCGSRILVQEKIYDEFVKKFVSEVQNMKIGDPSDENTKLGALISPEHLSKVEEYIKIAKDEGGTVLTGGYPNLPKEFKNGNWISPTVIADLDVNSRCSTEEIFGPVVTIHKFSNEKEAVEIANNTRYGLAGSIWTNDLEKANRVAESIHTGMIWINTWLHRDLRVPFGGVKDSGVGREGGKWSLSFFSEAMNICIKHK
ncbi:MAG: aldehyde dehydrogenase family protein [Candidatus Poseidoniales archaeon]|jgi:aminomuconate-semialdehyde/2-hydroxymuconate-6-semialdehyde dehydrogenase|uniref:Aldehyde dehydrogenase (DmpC) n=1 Tax=uncultured Poseidoniia archaeon TaxID=1697135 RepID=A0A1B1TEC2_9ARCH|nr:Aldehyde dehydrogenase (dmpC) [uncultured Candidatus Thalassoarchaea sp.]MDC0555603.1 aldehyde dehydrogenase [Euryarchaeota archaeon]MDC0576421.1 aldehyde dehydrogenase [Euryarchaeota archaeon]RCH74950.1 MAG: aldehyde dehydrogenase family protein [Candidatus Poseidoniales archaeon]RCH75712.1 MAG: aldehyde dehydrogenase family protein [Candidatus Poseidoniales archaeon]|tara:strand:+ start:3270 stop:4733 length:1464 start_codon:yes stop_codon:yes gene_type:complete